jgi:GNAT superfamily N-acetyltransferase
VILKILRLSRLDRGETIQPFDCGDYDLNEFLTEHAAEYESQMLAVTYLIEPKTRDRTIAFYSLLNDKVSISDVDSNRKWKKIFSDTLPKGKRFKIYPAVKIGRLGVDVSMKGQGIGTKIIDYIISNFQNDRRSGCKYLTVDAYRDSLSFYVKNGFKFLTEKDSSAATRLMYFDLEILP